MHKQKAAEFGQFCRGEPQNFANWPRWPAEFGKIYRGKLGPTDKVGVSA